MQNITFELNEEEIKELYGFCKGIVIQNNKNSTNSFVTLMFKIDAILENIVDQETKAETSMTLQSFLNASKSDIISFQKFENGFMGLIDKAEEEKDKLQKDIDNL